MVQAKIKHKLLELFSEDGERLYRYWCQRLAATGAIGNVTDRLPEKLNTMVVYPGTFGDFHGLIRVLPRLRDLGVNQIHILPFYEATGDDGFEVVNRTLAVPLRVADEWGGISMFKKLVKRAKNLKMSLMADAVLNHISSYSPILKQVGLKKLTRSWLKNKIPFKFLRLESGAAGGVEAIYRFNGRKVRRIVIFPEQADPKQPHLVLIGRRLVWHTFYPNQLDLDLNQPEAFKLAMNTILQIADLLEGRGTIRLDAIPFVGKVINREKFEFISGTREKPLIVLLRLMLAVKAPQMTMIAEAARPLTKMSQYVKLVGGNYDFLSFPRFIAAIASENAARLIDAVNLSIQTIGLNVLENLAFTVQTHDDIPLAELGSFDLSREVWVSLKKLGALPFGTKEANSIPKGAVIRLMDVCGGNPDKLAVAFFLAAMMPHRRLLWLYGTEVGLCGSPENYQADSVLAKAVGRKSDARSFIRQPLAVKDYLKKLDGAAAGKIGAILKLRLNQLPDKFDSWSAAVVGSVVKIAFSGRKNKQKISGQAMVNLHLPYNYEIKNNNFGNQRRDRGGKSAGADAAVN